MIRRPDDLDWTYIRSFLAVAETGSLTAAAKRTGQSQPTLSRHIKFVESALAAELFVRVHDGLRLTDTGRELLEPAREMAKASSQFLSILAGQETKLSGTVRITASLVVSHYVLPYTIAGLRRAEPDIEIELVPSDTSESLVFREADIAVRMYRPTQLDVIARKVAEQPMAMYAAKALLNKLGNPETSEEMAGLPFVGFDQSDLIVKTMRETGLTVDRSFFGVRCDNQSVFWELIRAGCGIGAMQTLIGDQDPFVTRTNYQPELPRLPVWLASTDALQKSPRIKRVWDYLVEDLTSRMG